MKKIVLVGAGGHSKSVIEVIKERRNFEIIYILSKEKQKKNKIYKTYSIDNLKKILKISKNIHIAFGQIRNNSNREKEFLKLKKMGFKFPAIISKNAIVSKNIKIGEGSIILSGCVINTGTIIGKNSIINSGAIIEHDTVIGDHCHIAPGAILNGSVKVKNNCFIGSGSIIKQSVVIKNKSFIQAGKFINK